MQAFRSAFLPSPFRELQTPLQSLYTTSTGDLAVDSECKGVVRAGEEAHHCTAARVSSRPCLIAGNSRQFDEVNFGGRDDR
jgi:hypothetical protein